MAALDNIASELLKSANEADLIYKRTRDQAQRDKAVRLRRIVENLKAISAGGLTPTLDEVLTEGNVSTNTLNVGGITSDYFQLDTAATPTLAPGMFAWNDAYGTADLRLKGNNVTLQVGQEILARVVNKTGSDLLESQYKVVRVRIASEGGAQGQRLAVVLAQGNNDPDSATTLGIVTEDIPNNQEGFITIFGNVNNINTTGSLQGETWVDGDVLYLSPTTPGSLTKVKPVAPQHTVIIGYVVYAHNNQGKIFVKVDNGYELDELHNVLITSPANNDLLQYNSAQQVWKNVASSVAVPTPTLAQVTTAGNTTTNAISTGNITASASNIASLTLLDTLQPYSWQIRNNGTSLLFVNNSGNNLFRINANGNVLIGTNTDAGYKLDVSGIVRLNAASGNDIITDGTNVTINGYASTGSVSRFQARNAASTLIYKFVVPNQTDTAARFIGNVGFGINTPVANIHTAGSITAASSLAQGVYFNNTLVAAANNDVLVGLDINPTFTNGAFTGVSNLAARIQGNTEISRTGADTQLTVARGGGASFTIQGKANSTSQSEGVNLYWTNNTWLKFVLGSSVVANFSNVGNLLVGTSTDAGYKLDVNGTLRVSGVASLTSIAGQTTIATGAVFNADTTVFTITGGRGNNQDGVLSINTSIASFTPNYGGVKNMLNIGGNFTVGSAATGDVNFLNINPIINYPVGSSGTQRAIYINPTLTRVTNYKAIEVAQGIIVTTAPITASSALAQGVYFNNTLVAAANNDVLVGLDINPTFTNGAFTGISNYAIRTAGKILSIYDAPYDSTATNSNFVLQHSNGNQAGIGITSDGAMRVKAPGGSPLVIMSGSVQTWFNRYGHSSIQAFNSDFGIYGVSDTQKFRIFNSTGNVLIQNGGIFTDAGYKLDVNGIARVGDSGGSGQLYIKGFAGTGQYLYLDDGSKVWSLVGSTNYSIQENGTSRLIVKEGGNVGIGTTNPTDKFHIVDNTNGNKFGRISAGGTDASAAWVAQNDQVDNIVYRVFGSAVTGSQMGQALARSASLIANLGGTGKFLIGSYSGTDLIFGTSDQARMRLVDATGNFLIGTMTDTGNKLTVSGNIDAQGYKVNNVLGYTGILNIPTNPPGQQNIDIQGGIVINIF